jgi:hypothetical protein
MSRFIRLSLSKGEGRVRVQHWPLRTPHVDPLPFTRGEVESYRRREMASIRSRNVTGRAFANNADDILRRARTSVLVRFALLPAG